MADFLKAIDWTRPWLKPFLPLASQLSQSADWRHCINTVAAQQGLKNHRGYPIHFVPQTDLPAGMAYEAFISNSGGIPTRENLHDFFNALVWLTFPQIKVKLNALQAAEISKASVITTTNTPRGKIRDAATIFDENGALIVTREDDLIHDLREHRWQKIFVERRGSLDQTWEVWLFGHALMEKLVTPYKAITAHALPIIAGDDFFDMPPGSKQHWLTEVATQVFSSNFSTSDLTPLPILGVPTWWHQQDETFYQDEAVFRQKRR